MSQLASVPIDQGVAQLSERLVPNAPPLLPAARPVRIWKAMTNPEAHVMTTDPDPPPLELELVLQRELRHEEVQPRESRIGMRFTATLRRSEGKRRPANSNCSRNCLSQNGYGKEGLLPAHRFGAMPGKFATPHIHFRLALGPGPGWGVLSTDHWAGNL